MTTEAVEEQVVDDAGVQGANEKDVARASGERTRAVELAALAVALVTFLAALVAWTKADDHDAAAVARAELRDTVLITARSHIETMNTLDYRDVDGGLKKWQAVSTGTMKDQLVAIDQKTRQLMADQGKVTTSKVVDAAVIELTKDTATVIAMVAVTVRDGLDTDAEPSVKRNRFSADLVKVGGRWLLESLDQVAVNLS